MHTNKHTKPEQNRRFVAVVLAALLGVVVAACIISLLLFCLLVMMAVVGFLYAFVDRKSYVVVVVIDVIFLTDSGLSWSLFMMMV